MNYYSYITALREKTIEHGHIVSAEEATILIDTPKENLFDLIAAANAIRLAFKGETVSLCSIINAKSGLCSEDCAFCSQSVHASANVAEYSLIAKEKVLSGAEEAIEAGAHKFGIVTSGKGLTGRDLDQVEEMLEYLKQGSNVHRCASLGVLSREQLQRLKDNGLAEYHHNLETSRSFYPQICTTRNYEENVETIKNAKAVGLRTCCGGILGMGESKSQQIELALELRSIEVDSVPLNFLNPIPGTKLENQPRLKPLEILRIIAVFRFLLPKTDIKVAGGREINLRQLQPLIFAAGANSMMVGNYLTTRGRNIEEDFQMLGDLEINYCRPC